MSQPSRLPAQQRTVFLHIGIHKTGTSAIQNVCRANHRALLKAGILFPRAGFHGRALDHPTGTSGHRGLLGFLTAPSASNVPKAGQALLRQIESGKWNRLVLSSEALSAPRNQGAIECVAWFRQQGFEVKLIAYLRRQDSWLDSFYRERLKWNVPKSRDARSIEEFWRAEGDAWLSYKRRIGDWVAAVGREHAHIRSYEDVNTNGGVVRDFLEIVGADLNQLDLAQSLDLHNPSIPPAAVELLRAVNALPATVLPRKRPLIQALRRIERFSRPAGSIVAPALWQEIAEAYGDENEELRSSWFSGQSTKFSFREGPGPAPFVEQAVSFAEGIILIEGLVRAMTPAGPTPSTVD
jgi:hypothetical protein